jgi:dolichol kinase
MERIKLLLFSFIIAELAATSLKYITNAAEYSHLEPTSGAFSIMFPLLGHVIFPIFYFIGLLVSWYEIFGGLSCWLDLGEGIALAGLGYGIAEAIIFRQKKVIARKDERLRKGVHIISNLSACLFVWVLGIQTMSYLVLIGTYTGILVMHLTMIGIRVPGIQETLRNVGREGEIPGEGALYNALGILFAIGLLRNDQAAVISVILILALGDGFATYIGTSYGRHKLPWNKNKTLEGTIGFAAGAIWALVAMPIPVTILIVVLAMIIESVPMRVNDNLILPVVSSLLYYLML